MTPEQESKYAKLKYTAMINERGRLMSVIALNKAEAAVRICRQELQESKRLAAEAQLKVLEFEVFELNLYPMPTPA